MSDRGESSRKRKRDEDLPRITFHAPNRTFDRLFREESLSGLKDVVRQKLGLSSASAICLSQLRDGQTIDLDDDDDFDAFCSVAFSKSAINVSISITEEMHAVSSQNDASQSSTIQDLQPLHTEDPPPPPPPPRQDMNSPALPLDTPSTVIGDNEPRKKKHKPQHEAPDVVSEEQETASTAVDNLSTIRNNEPSSRHDSPEPEVTVPFPLPAFERIGPPKKRPTKKKPAQESNSLNNEKEAQPSKSISTHGDPPVPKTNTKTRPRTKSTSKATPRTEEAEVQNPTDSPVVETPAAASKKGKSQAGSEGAEKTSKGTKAVATPKRTPKTTKQKQKGKDEAVPLATVPTDIPRESSPAPVDSPVQTLQNSNKESNAVQEAAADSTPKSAMRPELMEAAVKEVARFLTAARKAKMEEAQAAAKPKPKPKPRSKSTKSGPQPCIICGKRATHPVDKCSVILAGRLSIEHRLAELEKAAEQSETTAEAIEKLKAVLKEKHPNPAPLHMSSPGNNKSLASKSQSSARPSPSSSSESEPDAPMATAAPVITQPITEANTSLASLDLEAIMRGPAGPTTGIADLTSEESSEEEEEEETMQLLLEDDDESTKTRPRRPLRPSQRMIQSTDEEEDTEDDNEPNGKGAAEIANTSSPRDTINKPGSDAGGSDVDADPKFKDVDQHGDSMEIDESGDIAFSSALAADAAFIGLSASLAESPVVDSYAGQTLIEGRDTRDAPPSSNLSDDSAQSRNHSSKAAEAGTRDSAEMNADTHTPSDPKPPKKAPRMKISELLAPRPPILPPSAKSRTSRSAKTLHKVVNLQHKSTKKKRDLDGESDNDSVATWAVLEETSPETPSWMVDELRSSPMDDVQRGSSKKPNALTAPPGKSSDSASVLAQSQVQFPYAEWRNGANPFAPKGKKKDDSEDDEEEEESNPLSVPRKARSAAPQFRRLTDIASQSALFEPPQSRPPKFTREDIISDMYGNFKGSSKPTIDDSSSSSDSGARRSHIPKSRLAGHRR